MNDVDGLQRMQAMWIEWGQPAGLARKIRVEAPKVRAEGMWRATSIRLLRVLAYGWARSAAGAERCY